MFLDLIFFYHLPLVAGILAFLPSGLGSYLMRATASHSYKGLVAAALFEPAADHSRTMAGHQLGV